MARADNPLQREFSRTVFVAAASVCIGLALVVLLLDQAARLYLPTPPTSLYVLPPHSTLSYRTSEYQFTAETNAIGLRDHEVDTDRKPGFRVLAIGDSFTYGWGVDLADSWPKVLERRLTGAGHPTEVLNLGCPGAGVDAYADVAEQMIPLLKPDLVLVAVLQGIDIKLQNMGKTADRLFQYKIDDIARLAPPGVLHVVPHLYDLRARLAAEARLTQSADEIRNEWKDMAANIPRHLKGAEKVRFDSLDGQVKAMLASGDLNPWEVYFAVKFPDYVSFTLHPERAEVQDAVASMASSLERIKQASMISHAHVVVLSVTPAWYVNREALLFKHEVGYQLDESALGSDAPDDLIRSASQKAGLDFHSFTNRFRQVDSRRKWFFDFDGMYNAEGYARYGAEVAGMLAQQLQ